MDRMRLLSFKAYGILSDVIPASLKLLWTSLSTALEKCWDLKTLL